MKKKSEILWSFKDLINNLLTDFLKMIGNNVKKWLRSLLINLFINPYLRLPKAGPKTKF